MTVPNSLNSSIPVGALYSFNGPVCPTCHRGYLGRHECSIGDLQQQIDALQAKIDQLNVRPPQLHQCPCTPANGGARVCMNIDCPFATKVTC
jgi:hypothetical protein